MEIVLSLIICAVIIGVPTWLIYRAFKKAEENTVVYSPEEVTSRLRKGFFLSGWGLDLLIGCVLSFVLMLFDVSIVLKFAAPIGLVIAGFILFIIGRMKVGLTTRYLNFCNRKRTELEDWVLNAMLGIETTAAEVNGLNAITRATPGATDNIITAIHSGDVISGFMAVGRVYTGKNILVNHWPLIVVLLVISVSVLVTVV